MKILLLVATLVLSLNAFAGGSRIGSGGDYKGSSVNSEGPVTVGAGPEEYRGNGFGDGLGKNASSGRAEGSTSGAGPDELRGIGRLRSVGFGGNTQGKEN